MRRIREFSERIFMMRIQGSLLFSAIMLVLVFSVECFGGENVSNLCKRDFFIDRSKSAWQGYTANYEQEQAGKKIAAVHITPEMVRLPHLASFTFDGIPLMAIDRANKRVVVSGTFFSQMNRPDATRMNPGETFVMGKVIDARLLEKAPELVEFLLESQLIETYQHLESTLKCVGQNNTKDLFTADFTGSHVYFTNDRNEDPLAFRVLIDKKTGEISVTGK